METPLQNLLLVIAGQGFFLAMLLVLRGRRNRGARVPAILVLLCSLDLLQRSLEIGGSPYSDALLLFTYPLGFVYGPLFLLDTRIRTGARARLSGRDAVHLLPYAFYILISIYFFETNDLKSTGYVEALRSLELPWWMLALEFAVYPWIFVYLIASRLQLRQFRERLHTSCSSTELLELRWLRNLHRLLAASCATAAFAFATLFVFDDAFADRIGFLAYAAIVAIIYLVGYIAILYPAALTGAENAPDSEARYERNRLSDARLDEYLKRIQNYAEKSRAYLEPELKLGDFARGAGLPAHHVSQTINRREGQNFFRFINEYRVRHARAALRDPDLSDRTIFRIALDSGFNSKATFNAVFKEYTGASPSAYRKSAGKKGG